MAERNLSGSLGESGRSGDGGETAASAADEPKSSQGAVGWVPEANSFAKLIPTAIPSVRSLLGGDGRSGDGEETAEAAADGKLGLVGWVSETHSFPQLIPRTSPTAKSSQSSESVADGRCWVSGVRWQVGWFADTNFFLPD